MKVLFIAALALAPLAGLSSLGHEPAPRQSAQSFDLELTGLGLGPVGMLDASSGNCVAIRAQGGAAILHGRAELTPRDGVGPARLQLASVAPRVGRESVTGLAPLSMELRPFELATREDRAVVGVELAEGSVAAAVGKRMTLTIAIEHVGAPISLAVEPCGS